MNAYRIQPEQNSSMTTDHIYAPVTNSQIWQMDIFHPVKLDSTISLLALVLKME